ncbi:Nucleotide-binding alpha-beta plait [Penicillium paradoxum]|uniref:Nucleotide-binding alpha-beta plait n=1 Tax=Penicillium paradoxum TaxID=176176 RepID=UPI0025498078|nr:Nucleotide-binding alpha-beta plait [Penicillium paradoxum]KAJ5787785.1 Nucleotide-binding alpha-beta plait [Penicillium paradoxum]
MDFDPIDDSQGTAPVPAELTTVTAQVEGDFLFRNAPSSATTVSSPFDLELPPFSVTSSSESSLGAPGPTAPNSVPSTESFVLLSPRSSLSEAPQEHSHRNQSPVSDPIPASLASTNITSSFPSLDDLSDSFKMSWPFNGGALPSEGEFARFEKSSVEELLQPRSIPFASIVEDPLPPRTGVLKISNIPYTLTRQEVTSFLGHSAKQIQSPTHGSPIHIIMERSTGKTMDCFVEFPTEKEAQDAVNRLNRSYDPGSTPRMGNRHIDIEISSQAKLLEAIFPLAKCIEWVDGNPVKQENKDEWSTGFNGFLTDEELFCLARHAEQPHRSAFANKVPQRCYESMITTIWKFPWHAPHLYTVHHRNALFKTLGAMIRLLVERIQKQNTIGLDSRLLTELVQAGFSCPAFNPRMKYCFAWWSQNSRAIQTMDHDWCLYFPFDTLTYAPDHDASTIQYYAYLMSKGSVLRTEMNGLPNKHTHPQIERIFGAAWFEWTDSVAYEMKWDAAISYEKNVLRQFIITGFQNLRRRQSSISTIGTAPDSPDGSVRSLDSERTISAINSDSVNPSPAPDHISTLPAAGYLTGGAHPVGHGRNVSVDVHRDFFGMVTHQYPMSGLPTFQHRPSVPPYRPPHSRVSVEQVDNWRMPHEGRSAYHAPHSTSHNVRSSSDPFGPGPSVFPASQRSRSDATRQMTSRDRQVSDSVRSAGHSQFFKK